jgi:adenosylhomocysteine nucleosidase
VTDPIAVVCALEIERRALAGLERPGVEIHVSGMGPEAAAAVGERLAQRPLRAMIATGFCGALSPLLEVGTVVVAERVVHENTGDVFDADDLMLAAAEGRRGTLVSASAVARIPADRAALNGLAVDLESAALARAARTADVPFIAIRAVSDRYRDRIPDIVGMLDHVGRPDRRALATFALRHPREIPRLIRLGRSANRAGAALAEGVGTLLTRLGV